MAAPVYSLTNSIGRFHFAYILSNICRSFGRILLIVVLTGVKWYFIVVFICISVGDGQGGLTCCCPWGHKESDMTEWLNWTELCHTFTWISHGCTRVPHPDPPSPSHPSRLSQCSSPDHPASYIEPGLAFYFTYDNTHVSMLFSNHPTLTFSHRIQKSCSLHLCLFCCLAYRVIVTIFLNSIYMC